MPGFTIHIAVAKEYAKKHPKEIKNIDEFIEGVIAPDYICLVDKHTNKNITHYGKWGDWTSNDQKIYLSEFLNDSKVELNTDYWKGYFIHLLTDSYFNKIFKQETEQAKQNQETFYNDYDCLNTEIIERYHVELIEKIIKYMNHVEQKPKYLKLEKIIQFIEEIANINLEEQAKLIGQKELERKE